MIYTQALIDDLLRQRISEFDQFQTINTDTLIFALTEIDVAKFSLLGLDVLVTSGIWSKPTGTKLVFVQVIGGGGSGASGANGDNTATRGSSGGGMPGSVTEQWFDEADLDFLENVTVGASVTGPAGVSGNSAGTAGNAGNPSSFGTVGPKLFADGGPGGNTGGTAGAAGKAPAISITFNFIHNSAGIQPGQLLIGNAGTAAAPSGTRGGDPFCFTGPGPGGGGGGLPVAGTTRAGGTGGGGKNALGQGIFQQTTITGGGGAIGGPGDDAIAPYFGSGAGGGTSHAVGVGDPGGNGGNPGGGGGGGGASRTTSGNGGNGARGEVRVWSYGIPTI